jgi:hypothetical protein
METQRKPPNPNGNPNFRSRWDNLGETATVRLPQSLHLAFKDLASDINDGKVKISDLKPRSDLLQKLEEFEQLQRQSWGKSNKQTGAFNTDSPRWTKYNEFKAWLANQGE